MYDSRLRLANQIYDEVKRHFQELVFKTVVQRNVKLSGTVLVTDFLLSYTMQSLQEQRTIWYLQKKL